MTTTSAPETSLGNPFDQLVWRSLSSNHASLSQSRPLCKRYDPNVAPFGAFEYQSAEAVASLAELMDPGQEVCLIDQKTYLIVSNFYPAPRFARCYTTGGTIPFREAILSHESFSA
jgi:hypothetical protein